MTLKVHPEYRIEQMTWKEFYPHFIEQRPKLFKDNLSFPTREVLEESELEAMKRLNKNMGEPFKLNLGLFKGSDLVGWSFGWQMDSETYYMTNSAVFPDHRRQGLYTALMRETIDLAMAEGFQIILSRHTATNNAVIIPKLKFGFIISSLEVSDVFGVMVHLRYYTNPKRKMMMDIRSGEGRPDSEMKTLLGL